MGSKIGMSKAQMFSVSIPGESADWVNKLQLNSVVMFINSSNPGTLLIREPVITVASKTRTEIVFEGILLTLSDSCMAMAEGLMLWQRKCLIL